MFMKVNKINYPQIWTAIEICIKLNQFLYNNILRILTNLSLWKILCLQYDG